MTIETMIAHYGLSAVFLGAGIEGETTIVVGGILAHRHIFPALAVAAAATAGSFCVDQLLFTLGSSFGRHPRIRTVLASPLARRALASLDRHPVAYVLGFRFLIGVRFVSPIVIGASGMSRSRFLPLNFLAALIWATLFTAAGFSVGGQIEPLLQRLPSSHLALFALGAVLVAISIAVLAHLRHFRSGALPAAAAPSRDRMGIR